MKMGFIVNMARCVGCNACVIACKSGNRLEPDMARRTVTEVEETAFGGVLRSYRSIACNHCDDPACMAACPVKAYAKAEDGVVAHNPELCIGCQMCLRVCPYEAPTFNPVTGKMSKCDMCLARRQEGLEPYCVAAGPMEALSIADFDTIDKSLYEKTVPGFPDITLTNPNVRFLVPKAGEQNRR